MASTAMVIMHMTRSKFWALALFAALSALSAQGQTILGTPGLMNIPTAEIRQGGTFDGGVSLLEQELEAVPTYYNNTAARNEFYNTGLYYINFAPFSFFDITLRETLVKSYKSSGEYGFYQQDRSLTLRVQPIREKDGCWWPSILIGSNDFYSRHGDSYYAAVYGVMTKTLPIKGLGKFAITAGYAKPIRKGVLYNGAFGGISVSPYFAPMLRVMGEYDTRGVNVGIGAHLFRHLNLTCFTREFKGISATISYQYTIHF